MDTYLLQALDENPGDGYLQYHARRFNRLLELLHRYHPAKEAVLDIGRSPFSRIAQQSLHTQVDTLGFEADKKTPTGFNYRFDLNDAQQKDDWRTDLPQYATIVFSEVIEHLHTSPKLVLKFLRTLLKKEGVIIMQTPNAAALHKRIKLMFGWNPYHLIREDAGNPGHFREYTRDELARYCREAGFAIEHITIENYFDHRYRNHKAGVAHKTNIYGFLNYVFTCLPSALRPGLCFVIRKGKR